MRLTGREALYRSAAQLIRGTVPTMRELLLGLEILRTYLLPEADGPLPGADTLTAAGVSVVPVRTGNMIGNSRSRAVPARRPPGQRPRGRRVSGCVFTAVRGCSRGRR